MDLPMQSLTVDAPPDTEVDPDWDDLVALGIDARALEDRGKWQVGDLACAVTKRWSTDQAVIDYAVAIGLPRPKLIYDRRRTAAFWPKSARAEIAEECPVLSWSHYLAAAVQAAKHDDDLTLDEQREMAREWMHVASDNNYNVDVFKRFLKGDGADDYITRRQILPTVDAAHGYKPVTLWLSKADYQKYADAQARFGYYADLRVTWSEKVLKEESK